MSSYLIRTTNGDRVFTADKVRAYVSAGKIPPETRIRDQATGQLISAGEVADRPIVPAAEPASAGKVETVKTLPAWTSPDPAPVKALAPEPPPALQDEAEPAPPVRPATGRAVRTATVRTTRVATGKTTVKAPAKTATGRIARDPEDPEQPRQGTTRIGRRRQTPWLLYIGCGLVLAALVSLLVYTLFLKPTGPQIVGHWDLDPALSKEANRGNGRGADELKDLDTMIEARSHFMLDFGIDGKLTITLGDEKRQGGYQVVSKGQRQVKVDLDFPAVSPAGAVPAGPATAAAPAGPATVAAVEPVAAKPAEPATEEAPLPVEGQAPAVEVAAEGDGSATVASPTPPPKRQKKKADPPPPAVVEPAPIPPATASFRDHALSFYIDGDRMKVLDGQQLYMVFVRRPAH